MNISSLPSSLTTAPQANTASSSNSNTGQLIHSYDKQPSVPDASATDSSSSEDKRQTALQRLNTLVSQAYEKLSGQTSNGLATYSSIEPLSAEKVANNILGFIERRLTADASNGATQEQLQSRLEAGLSGFKKGFGEASEQLKALNLLSPDVEQDLDKTYKLVTDGVDDLRKKFIKDATPATANSSTQQNQTIKSGAATSNAVLDLPGVLKNPQAASASYTAKDYAEARSFHFELTTREGDKVTIDASSSFGASSESNTNGNSRSLNTSFSSSQSLTLSINGNLNDDELKSINDLLSRVNNLTEQFYAGDLDQAFNKAASLGYDDKQIANYSINLAQVQIQQVTEAYGAQQPAGDSTQSALGTELEPVGKFLKDLFATFDQTNMFQDPHKLLLDLSHLLESIAPKDDQGLAEQKSTEQDSTEKVSQADESRFESFMKKMMDLKPNSETSMQS